MHVRSMLKFFFLFLCLVSGGVVWSQTGVVVHGTVADPDDAVIPGATVTFSPAGGKALLATSQDDGTYTLKGVPSGLYAVTVTMKGFSTFVKQGVRISANQPFTLDVKLAIQEQSQEVQVNAQSNQLSVDSDANASATVIKDKDLDALSDDPDELSSELSALAGPASGPSGGQIYVDGFTGGQLPPKSSIREIRINQNPFSAQFDKIGYGRVEVFTKPGTDKFHGNYSVQGGDNKFNTSNPFLGSANVQPPYHTLFMIGSVTGPINRYSSFSVGGSHRTIQDNSIVNPTNFYADPANPTTLCQPTTPGTTSPCVVTGSLPATARAVFHPQTRSDITPRLDLAIGEKNTLTARYQYYVNGQQNAGVGNTSLQTVGYSTDASENTIQLSDTQLINSHVINETRFEYERDHSLQTPNSLAPTVSVQGIVTGGGSSQGRSESTEAHIEAQNYTSVQLAKHFMRFGGRLRTTQETLTSNAGQNGTFTYTSLANYITGTSQQFRQTVITNPTISNRLTDVGIYAEDDWKFRPNFMISYGLRYEAENVIHSNHDLAPRFAISYGIPHKGGQPVTVIRVGYGIFYDRFQQSDVLTAIQYNGQNQSQNVVQNPNPNTCQPGALAGCGGAVSSVLGSTVYTLAPNLRSSYNQQAAFGVDQQLGRVGTVSATYITAKGIHQYLSRAVTNDQGQPSPTSYNNQYFSGGYYEEQQLLINSNIRMKKLQLWGFYSLNFGNANTGGSTTFATDVNNRRIDDGNASFVHRNFVVTGGSYQLPLHITLSPFLLAQSGTFYNITAGTDRNFDGQFNDRPYFATGNQGDCRNAADYSLTQNAAGTLTQVPVNYCVGPANVTVNLRVGKTIGFGPENKPSAGASGGPGGPGGGRGGRGGGPGGGGGGGPMGGFGASSTGRRYNLTLGAQGSNIFNQVPYGTPNSVVSSAQQFGRFTTLAGRPFSSSTAVRQIVLQANFSF